MKPLRTKLMIAFVVLAMLVSACATQTPAPPAAPATEAPAPAAPAASTATTPAQQPTAPQSIDVSSGSVVLPEVDPAEVAGAIIAAGSSTVYPLTERMADRFEDEGFAGQITISSIGSGAGYERFCVQGETDIANASRAIKDSEVESCRAIGREPIEFRVGTDALAIVVSQENDFVEDLTLEELAKLFSNEVTLWSEVNPAWPAETIRRFAPGTDSGTFDFFIEEVMEVVYGDEGKTVFLEAENLQPVKMITCSSRASWAAPMLSATSASPTTRRTPALSRPSPSTASPPPLIPPSPATTPWLAPCSSTPTPASCRKNPRWPLSSTST
jgi:phosphate transport system substrate-binding protein